MAIVTFEKLKLEEVEAFSGMVEDMINNSKKIKGYNHNIGLLEKKLGTASDTHYIVARDSIDSAKFKYAGLSKAYMYEVCKKGLEKEISRIIGMTLLTDVKNETVKNYVSIHKVELTKDGRYLDLIFSILDLKNNVNKDKMSEELNKLKGFFRKKLGSQLSMRFVPEIRIHLDDSVEYGVKIASILNEIKKKESE